MSNPISSERGILRTKIVVNTAITVRHARKLIEIPPSMNLELTDMIRDIISDARDH